jgi:hypothetical protein
VQGTTTADAILAGAVVLAIVYGGAQFMQRYRVVTIPNSTSLYRLNTWTGDIELCTFERASGDGPSKLALRCVLSLP